MIERLHAEVFHGFQTRGNTRPARLTCRRADGTQVEVFGKFAGGVRNHYFGLCAELLSSQFASTLGLATPVPYLVEITPEFVASAPAIAQDLLNRSLGVNFASESLGEGYTTMAAETRLPVELRRCAAEIFAFDVLIQNYDRKADNPNMLWNRAKIYLIDHERALDPAQSAEKSHSVTSLDLDRFYDHVLYGSLSPSDCSLERLSGVLGGLTAGTLDGWFDSIPVIWRNASSLQRVRNYFEWLLERQQQICTLIQQRIA
jgi:hypothetical protein